MYLVYHVYHEFSSHRTNVFVGGFWGPKGRESYLSKWKEARSCGSDGQLQVKGMSAQAT